jgi:hypothetical protein
MIKKVLIKTLLPISTVTLLGGGIASLLTLTSCSSNKVILKSSAQAAKYLENNVVSLGSGTYHYNTVDEVEVLDDNSV